MGEATSIRLTVLIKPKGAPDVSVTERPSPNRAPDCLDGHVPVHARRSLRAELLAVQRHRLERGEGVLDAHQRERRATTVGERHDYSDLVADSCRRRHRTRRLATIEPVARDERRAHERKDPRRDHEQPPRLCRACGGDEEPADRHYDESASGEATTHGSLSR
jgi:hypothetical protein